MARVLLENLSKRFDDTDVVKGINLEINDKEFVVLVGPSGCGKSTTLRMIAGLETPTGGEIYFGDKPVTDLVVKDRNIAMVFQSYALYPHMNVYKNMAFGLKMRGVSKDEIDASVRKSAAILGIEQLLNRRPRQLSGGQRQRVALGRAIVRDPDVFLLDEPLSNLDAKLRVQMRGEIVKLRKRLEATMVYVTHDQVEAMSMGDRIVVMSDGEIQQVGAPLEVYSKPHNTFVAGFVGNRSMNFFDGVIDRQGDAPAVKLASGRFALPEHMSHSDKLAEGRKVILGARPEHMRLHRGAADTAIYPLEAVVEVAEPLGSALVLELSSAAGDFVTEIDPDEAVRAGDRVRIVPDPAKIHLFDPETGLNLFAGD